MYFDELSNDEWELLAPMLSDKPTTRVSRRGRPRADPRIVANAILWILTTGEPWSSLPGRYPSGPTCRCRFEDWQLNGTLAKIIRLLTQVGRTFAYLPNGSSAVTRSALRRGGRGQCEDGLRSVLWKSPESWQAPPHQIDGRHLIDPFDEITRQLSGRAIDTPIRTQSSAMMTASSPQQFGCPCGTPWTAAPVVSHDGYVIRASADPVSKELFRAWVEIMRHERRIERSGLIGPRFEDFEVAPQYALDWARKWIDQQSTGQIVSQTASAINVARWPIVRSLPDPVMEEAYEETEYEDDSFGLSLSEAMVK
ncbi:Transposase [Burkholderia sp. D7]|nr:Transposase [Burkholderia sp. D7]